MPETATLVRFEINITAFLSLFLLISGCGDLSEYENRQVAEALSDSVLTTTFTRNPTMDFLENNRLKLRLTGSSASSTKNNNINITRIGGPVHIDIYNDDGGLDTVVDADSAVYYPQRSVFEMYGGVVVEAPGDRSLRSEFLKWDRNQDRVTTDQFVTLVTPADSLTGNTFSGTSDLSEWNITSSGDGGGRMVID